VIDDDDVVQNITEELHSNRTAIDTLHEQASNLGEQVSCCCDAVLSSTLRYTSLSGVIPTFKHLQQCLLFSSCVSL